MRNETPENCLPRDSRSVASFVLFVGINSTVLRRTTQGGRGRRCVDCDDFIVENQTNVKIFKKFMKKCCN
nr:MAG TPA: hypothetical protein [Caudoviricetes sp.]